MNYLEKIVAQQREEINNLLQSNPLLSNETERNAIEQIKQNRFYSLKDKIKNSNEIHLITEFKRASPSKGIINNLISVQAQTQAYQEGGASAISILTNSNFMGSEKDIVNARPYLNIPILRKEFIVNEFQVFETAALGANILLLIAAALSKDELIQLSKLAQQLQLEVLMEFHEPNEFEKVDFNYIDFVGINNRNLKTFKVDIMHSVQMCKLLPLEFVKIAESGIENHDAIKLLHDQGFKGFLIGEHLMKSNNPKQEMNKFKYGK